MLLLRRAARPLVSRHTTATTTRRSLQKVNLSLTATSQAKQLAWATSATDWYSPLDLSTKGINMVKLSPGAPRKKKQEYCFITEEECDLAMALISAGYQEKLVEMLTERYNLYSGPLIPDTDVVRQMLAVCAYIAWVILSGCRPESFNLIHVDDVKVIVSPATPANRGEDLFELEEIDTHVIYIEYEQSKRKVLYEQCLIAEKPWEKNCIVLIHRFCGDVRFSRSADDLLFKFSSNSGNYGKSLAKEIMTAAAILCGVGEEMTFKNLRQVFACTTMHDSLDDFIKKRRYHADNNKNGIRPGSRDGGRKCSAFIAQTMRTVSIRLGHRQPIEKKSLAPYVDPRIVVHFAHDMGFHRNTMIGYKYLTGSSRGIEHPWLSDSDEDDDDYQKAEDTWGQESDGDD